MLKLSQIGDNALHAMYYIAQRHPELVHIRDIATHYDMSESFLRLIVADLAKNDIIETQKGRNGGVRLARKGEEISFFDILFAVWEELSMTDCTKGKACRTQAICHHDKIIDNMERGIHTLLKIHTLATVVSK